VSVPPLLLERLVNGGLDEAERERVLERLRAEPGGTERLKALEDENASILAQFPPARFKADFERRRGKRVVRSAWLLPLPALAVGALLFWVTPSGDLPEPGLRAKGESETVEFHAYRSGEELFSGAQASPGDRLQCSTVVRREGYLAVVSVDGRGVTTLHYPETPGTAVTVAAQPDEQALPSSYALDDTPGFEKFFAVWCDAPFTTREVMRAAAEWTRAGSLEKALGEGRLAHLSRSVEKHHLGPQVGADTLLEVACSSHG